MFFNRDEQRLRATAISPSYDEKLSAIYPIDPQGNGTWLAVSRRGMTFALLNNYQASPQQHLNSQTQHQIDQSNVDIHNKKISHYTSRGQLITSILQHQALHSTSSNYETAMVENILNNLALEQYQPFTLCVFSSGLNAEQVIKQLGAANQQQHVKVLQWNGDKLKSEPINQMLTSSGKNIDLVTKERKNAYRRVIEQQTVSSQHFVNFHLQATLPSGSSVRMSREDACTVSFSHIKINKQIHFQYSDLIHDTKATITLDKIS